MKIGILTYFGVHNYGAFLQAFALRELISNYTNENVELINYRTVKEINVYSVKIRSLLRIKNFTQNLKEFIYNKQQYKTFEKCILKYQTLSKEELISNSINEFRDFVNNRYDLIIVGSDEIWKTDGFRQFPNAYWLPNVQCRKMAYAVSSRNTTDMLSDDKKSLIREYIESFDYIGTRDSATFNLISGLSHNSEKCHMNCDPTFLYDFSADVENGRKILRQKFSVKSSKRIIGLILSDSHYGQSISQSLNKDFEVVSLSSYIHGAKNYAELTPFEWIDVISACDMIISSRFHGVVFSIKNNRPFLAIEMDGYSLKTSKLYDLLERNNLLHSYIGSNELCSNVLNYQIKSFLKESQQNNYIVDYSDVVASEKKMAASFFNKLCTFKYDY